LLVVKGEDNKMRSILSPCHHKWIAVSVVVITATCNGLRLGLNRNVWFVVPIIWMLMLGLRSLYRILSISLMLLAVLKEASEQRAREVFVGRSSPRETRVQQDETREKHAAMKARLRKMKLTSLGVMLLFPAWMVAQELRLGFEHEAIVYDGPAMVMKLSSLKSWTSDMVHFLYTCGTVYVIWIPADVRRQLQISTGPVADVIPPKPTAWVVQESFGEESSSPLRAPFEMSSTPMLSRSRGPAAHV
jgi:hypothetical protein